MQTSVLTEIMAFLFGRKYYANIIYTKGTAKQEMSSFIFASREAANTHRDQLAFNNSYGYVETISFRSRNIRYSSVRS